MFKACQWSVPYIISLCPQALSILSRAIDVQRRMNRKRYKNGHSYWWLFQSNDIYVTQESQPAYCCDWIDTSSNSSNFLTRIGVLKKANVETNSARSISKVTHEVLTTTRTEKQYSISFKSRNCAITVNITQVSVEVIGQYFEITLKFTEFTHKAEKKRLESHLAKV